MSEETSPDHAFFLINIITKVIGSLLIVRIVLEQVPKELYKLWVMNFLNNSFTET